MSTVGKADGAAADVNGAVWMMLARRWAKMARSGQVQRA